MDYTPVFNERARRLIEIRKNPVYLASCKLIYKNDPVKFINDWLITYNPQNKPTAIIPFVLFPKQEDLIRFFKDKNDNREDGLCEKCRNVGFTWLAIGFSIWLWLFYPEQKISFGSRKEDLVDTIDDPDSIFEKIRIALRYLPKEFLPLGFNVDVHTSFMKIINPENGSRITGEAGDNIGRGGRSTIYFLDEFAFLERPQKVEAALSENSDCKIYISTPNGVGNPFHQKRFGGIISVFTFNWYDDPRKDQAWFDKKKAITDSVIFAQEILIDYGASLENVTIPAAWVKAAVNFRIPGIDSGARSAGLDVADEGADSNALIIRKGSFTESVEMWKEGNTTQTARKAYSKSTLADVDALCYDSIGVGAGVKGELSTITDIPFQVVGVNTGEAPFPGEYARGKKNKDMFLNLKAQLWWLLRRRFERVYSLKDNPNVSPDDLISIPNDTDLINELSMPKFFFAENGKIKIESKKDMKRRGLKSPNKADALVIAFAPFKLIAREPTIRTL